MFQYYFHRFRDLQSFFNYSVQMEPRMKFPLLQTRVPRIKFPLERKINCKLLS